MTQRVLLFSHDLHMLEQLKRTPNIECVLCDSLVTLSAELENAPTQAVLVHLTSSVINGLQPAHFVTELERAVSTAAVYGLADDQTSVRLQQLFEMTFDGCLELPLRDTDVASALMHRFDLESDLERFWSQMPHQELHGRTRSLVTFTPEMFEMLEEIKVAAKHKVTSLLIGETGCGKTFLARLIHELSEEREERFCTVACGALPPDLIESELFGSIKGAFTGADRDRDGKFAAAGRGTLLLDEIDVLPPEQQAKLLRVIETGEYEPVGSNETQTFEGRMIVASNYNLEDLVNAGTFRTDLYYRLNILNLRLLPLRERPLDIEYLARKFALEHGRTHGIQICGIEADFLGALRQYPWPGNVREMENVIRRAVLYCQRGVLRLTDLPSSIRQVTAPTPLARTAPSQIRAGTPVLSDRVTLQQQRQSPTSLGGWPPVTPPQTPANDLPPREGWPATSIPNRMESVAHTASEQIGASADEPRSLEARVDRLECEIIQDCLQRNNHRRKDTAAELGISRVTLYNKMKKFGLM